MKRIENLHQLSPMISAQFRRGVMTNAPFAPDAFAPEIHAGTLYARELPGGLLLLRRREDFDRLQFYLQPEAQAVDWRPERTTVLEIPAKPNDPNGARLARIWCAAGFENTFTRRRLVRVGKGPVLPGRAGCDIRTAGAEDLSRVIALLEKHYDRRTACLPAADELSRDIADGGVIVALDGGQLVGTLHMTRNKRLMELRHVAVETEYRGRGLAPAMMACFDNASDVQKYQLWVAQNNASALRLYEKLGFTPDGWTSGVWLFERN